MRLRLLHLLVQRRHAVRLRLRVRGGGVREPRGPDLLLAEHGRDARREQHDHGARHPERDQGGAGLPRPRHGHVPGLRLPRCHHEQPVFHLPAGELEHAACGGFEGAAVADRAVPLPLRDRRRQRRPGHLLRGTADVHDQVRRPPLGVPEPPDPQHLPRRRGPGRPLLSEDDPRLRRLHGPLVGPADPAQAGHRADLAKPARHGRGPQDRDPGQEQGPLLDEGHARRQDGEAGRHG
mmetsp:Transcript_31830/g.91351  ORF Transcript_31830/g.91351 Transcript_31830/m.91351 type:complete len:236 (-) Transcript_31830:834-1541(-)